MVSAVLRVLQLPLVTLCRLPFPWARNIVLCAVTQLQHSNTNSALSLSPQQVSKHAKRYTLPYHAMPHHTDTLVVCCLCFQYFTYFFFFAVFVFYRSLLFVFSLTARTHTHTEACARARPLRSS